MSCIRLSSSWSGSNAETALKSSREGSSHRGAPSQRGQSAAAGRTADVDGRPGRSLGTPCLFLSRVRTHRRAVRRTCRRERRLRVRSSAFFARSAWRVASSTCGSYTRTSYDPTQRAASSAVAHPSRTALPLAPSKPLCEAVFTLRAGPDRPDELLATTSLDGPARAIARRHARSSKTRALTFPFASAASSPGQRSGCG